jgi:hypothetical protein
MQMTGHKTRSVFDCYHIVSQGDLFEAARWLDEFRAHWRAHLHMIVCNLLLVSFITY